MNDGAHVPMASLPRAQEDAVPAGGIPKAATGIAGLDEITLGGLPRGRPTLVCGGAGCGKTLLAMEFLVRGATQFDEPGVCVTFEETEAELAENVRSLGFDVDGLVQRGMLAFDHVHIDRREMLDVEQRHAVGGFRAIPVAREAGQPCDPRL